MVPPTRLDFIRAQTDIPVYVVAPLHSFTFQICTFIKTFSYRFLIAVRGKEVFLIYRPLHKRSIFRPPLHCGVPPNGEHTAACGACDRAENTVTHRAVGPTCNHTGQFCVTSPKDTSIFSTTQFPDFSRSGEERFQ